jgi:hypothetical protein
VAPSKLNIGDLMKIKSFPKDLSAYKLYPVNTTNATRLLPKVSARSQISDLLLKKRRLDKLLNFYCLRYSK